MVTIKVPTAISGISRAQNKRFYRSTRLTPPINLIDTGQVPVFAADKAEALEAGKELFPGHRVTVVLKEGEPGT